MNVLVVDVAASESGALTILSQYYKKLLQNKDDHYYFCISTPQISDSENITVLKFPWVKKSWFHRLYFDYIISRKLLKKYKIDSILSLQNTVVPGTKLKQTVYLHQPLPFVEYRFKLMQNGKLWAYQRIISLFIFHSIKKADRLIVQTKWMKDAAIKRCRVSADKITVEQPDFERFITYKFKDTNEGRKTLFYPASSYIYKNHSIILEACKVLKEEGITDYTVVLTIDGTEDKNSVKLLKDSKKAGINFKFEGYMNHGKVLKMYSKSVLLFPSYIETFGLPLKEARMSDTYVIASDCAFSREILEDYKRAYFFDPFCASELAAAIKTVISMSEGDKQ